MNKTFYYHWQWNLKSSPEALWPLVTDTNRFNRDVGLPTVNDITENPQNFRRRLYSKEFGMRIEWIEEPFEWVRPYRFGVQRNYQSGPLQEMRVLCQLEALPDGGTHLDYEVWIRPKNLLGRLAVPFQIGYLTARKVQKTFERYDAIAHSSAPNPLLSTTPAPYQFSPTQKQRLNHYEKNLIDLGADPSLVQKLIHFIENGDDTTLCRIRPYALADLWEAPRRSVLELCLYATRVGLVEFQWEHICPVCRVTKHTPKSLSNVRSQVYCDSCGMDFDVDFEHTVELTFRPNPTIREVDPNQFCFSGPHFTPHIIIQQVLAPDSSREVQPVLETGRYRLRLPIQSSQLYLQANPYGQGEAQLNISAEQLDHQELQLSTMPLLHLSNHTDHEQLLILEQVAGDNKSASAADVTALQRFRDLFASEALRPGEQISVGSMSIVFTDLRGSTGLYTDIGDAPAFGLVMSHFDILRQAIDADGGAIVKTIGDAVMAVFRNPLAALRAMLNAQTQLATTSTERPLQLKVGVHNGACIAVTLNEKLDYFGSNVNIAARLESQSSGNDLIISNHIYTDPEVADWLSSEACPVIAEPFKTTLRGFGDEQFVLWRLYPKA